MCATAQMCIKWKWGTSISPFPPSNGLEYRHGRGSVLYHGEKSSILEIAEQQDRRKLVSKYFRATSPNFLVDCPFFPHLLVGG